MFFQLLNLIENNKMNTEELFIMSYANCNSVEVA